MKNQEININIIGGGLAGSEAANYLANKGYKVKLYERRPLIDDKAHVTSKMGELVCSNSLKNKNLDNACGLLKEEINRLGSLIMEASRVSEVPSGDALAVDRNVFADYIDKKIRNNPNIEVINQDVNDILDGYTIITTGPLTSKSLLDKISDITGKDVYGFYDASAPIIYKDSIDFSKVFTKDRYSHQNDGSYINCGMNKEEYLNFYNNLINAKKAHLHEIDKEYFEGCLPIEVIASRGIDTLRFGPLKPVGLTNEDKNYYAVVQLRQDDLIGEFYNMVGFQTNLTYGEQKRVFSLIPGLENAKFARYGLMHRNSYLFSPIVLNDDLSLKANSNVFIAGQLSGVEGYVESAATGLLAAIYLDLRIRSKTFKPLSFNTVLGALVRYITHTGKNNFQPMNANFGIIYGANRGDKSKVIDRSLKDIEAFKNYIND